MNGKGLPPFHQGAERALPGCPPPHLERDRIRWDSVARAFDIVVAGAGPVGRAFAASLAGAGLGIALTDHSVAMLAALSAWAKIPVGQIAPLRRMQVLNGPSDYAMQLGHGGTGSDMLGRFVPNHWLRRSLHAVVRDLPGMSVLPGLSVAAVRAQRGGTTATLSDGQVLTAALVVAADTRRSRLRRQQDIGAALHDYRQRMLVCPVAHPFPHRETATAWFEYGQTLVTLPLNGGRSSAVMTVGEADATALLRMDDAAFGRELTRRYRGRLGTMRPVGGRHAVPVVTAYAARFVGRRFALLGDAAVGMHPTTAHSFNFGMLGQHALARELQAARAAGRDVADPARPGALRGGAPCRDAAVLRRGGSADAALCGRRQPAGTPAAERGVAPGQPAPAAPRPGSADA